MTYDIFTITFIRCVSLFLYFQKNKDCRSWPFLFRPSLQVDLPTDQGFCCLLRPFQGHATRRAGPESTFGTAGCFAFFLGLDKKPPGFLRHEMGPNFWGVGSNNRKYTNGNVWGISLVRMMVPLGWGPLYNQPFFRGLQQRGLNS